MRIVSLALPATLTIAAACAPPPEKSSGQDLYAEFCVACHGVSGKGDGPDAAVLARKPADLTKLAARNGGTFPMMDVLSTIDGYTRARHGNLTMPEFGVMMEDQPSVMVDTGDGILTPTPEPLAALADYLRTLQE
jgi:mono/diheme cytochrome c family protein